MKKILWILLFVFLFSCEKEKVLPCEKNQTFTLVFYNYQLSGGYGYIKYLYVNNQSINVEYIFNELRYTVNLADAKNVYAIDRNNKKNYMLQIPGACATYNFFW